MRKAYIFLGLLMAWGILFWYLYIYHIKQLGSTPSEPAAITVPEPLQNTSSPKLLLFKPRTYGLIIEGGNAVLIDSILSEGQPNQILQITGLYSPNEQTGLDFDLGVARASELKKLLVSQIEENRIEIYSDTFSNFTYNRDSLIDAIFYEWVNGYVIEEEGTNYYLIDHPTKRVKSADFEALISTIAEKLVSTNKKVVIRGHTDNTGDKELNFTIALRNAKDIRDVLKAKGVNKTKIETTSRGEELPVSDNETESGRLMNRRIEIEIEE